MAAQINDYPLLINVETGEVLKDFRSAELGDLRSLVQGDTYRVLLRAVRPHPQRQVVLTQLWQDVSLPSQCYVAVGPVGGEPTAGTFKLTFGANTTGDIAYNAAAATVQTALNALASITSAGGVLVSGDAGGPWQVTFNTAGARTGISANTDALYPLSSSNIYTAREGTSELTEIQVISLERTPAALASSFTDFPAAAVTVVELQTGAAGVPAVQRVSINADAYAGTFTLTFDGVATGAIDFDADADDMLAALEALSNIGTGNVAVTGTSPEWVITFQGDLTGDQPALTGNAAGLTVPVGKIGELSLATAGIEQLVNGAAEVDTTLEVQVMPGGGKATTILQEGVTVLNDLTANSPGAPVGLPNYLTEEGSNSRYLRYDDAQTLTTEEQDQAVENLDLESRFLSSVPDGSVNAAKLASDSVTTAKILDANVTAAKLASDSVTTAKLLDANVTAAKLASNSVTTAKMVDGNVTEAKLADDAVTAAKLADGAVGTAALETISGVAGTIAVRSITVDAKGRITGYKTKYTAVINSGTNSNVQVGSTTADLDVLTLTIPANLLAAGDVIEFEMFGTTQNSTVASNFLTWVKVGGTKSTAVTHAMGTVAASNVGWHMRGSLRVYRVASGEAYIVGSFATQWKTTQAFSNTSTWVWSVNAALAITLGINFSVASGTVGVVYNARAELQ